MTYTIGQGTIIAVPEELVFPDAFPGRISSHSLKVNVKDWYSLSGSLSVFMVDYAGKFI